MAAVVSGRHEDLATGDGATVGRLLRRDVDHPRPTQWVEVGEGEIAHLVVTLVNLTGPEPHRAHPTAYRRVNRAGVDDLERGPGIDFSWLRSSSFQPGFGAPWKNQLLPLSATIKP